MTEKDKKTILDMRLAGKAYKEISDVMGIEISALKVFVHRQKHTQQNHNDVRWCAQCKKVLGIWKRSSRTAKLSLPY